MPDLTASRTLVKSHPELWTECSDADSLGRHLDGFGDIRITRLEPETAVAWEGEHARGTVTLEPSGWGTRVVLTATPAPEAQTPAAEPEPAMQLERLEVQAEPVAGQGEAEPVIVAEPPVRPGFFARLFARFRGAPVVIDDAEPVVEPEPVVQAPPPAAPVAEPPDPQAALLAALDSLGQAHHRPFSRA